MWVTSATCSNSIRNGLIAGGLCSTRTRSNILLGSRELPGAADGALQPQEALERRSLQFILSRTQQLDQLSCETRRWLTHFGDTPLECQLNVRRRRCRFHQVLEGRCVGGLDRPGSSRSSGCGVAFSATDGGTVGGSANALASSSAGLGGRGRHRSASLATGEVVSSPRHKVGGKRAGRVEVALKQGNGPGPGFAATGENIEDRRQFHRLG